MPLTTHGEAVAVPQMDPYTLWLVPGQGVLGRFTPLIHAVGEMKGEVPDPAQ